MSDFIIPLFGRKSKRKWPFDSLRSLRAGGDWFEKVGLAGFILKNLQEN
jgi:hypothetical protein